MLPDFFGIGAQRAGTTWVYNCLKQHPDIYMPQKKELQFFNAFYDRGLDWYESNFDSASNEQKVGEITPNYLQSEKALERMAKIVPDAKLFMVLRNPFERSFSAYQLFHNNLCKDMSFREACKNVRPVIRQSLYADAINKVYQYYPASKVKILLYDQIQLDKKVFLEEIYSFLGVSSGFMPENVNVRYNKIMFPGLQQFMIKNNMKWIIEGIKKSPANVFIRKNYNSYSKRKNMKMSQADFELLQQYFKDDIYETQSIIGKDLRHWLKR